MIHPNSQAISYIFYHFKQEYFSSETQDFTNALEKILIQRAHRPRWPQSEAHRLHLTGLLKQLYEMKQRAEELKYSKLVGRLEQDMNEVGQEIESIEISGQIGKS